MLGLNLGLRLSSTAGGTPTPTLTLSSTSIDEDAATGTTVGTLSVTNGSGTYTFTETADPDAKFAVSGSNLNTAAALDYETATSHSVTVQASNGVDDPISRVFTISVNNVNEAATLSALALDDTSVPEDSAATINITGATAGSTITVQSGSLPAGMTLNSGARTITGTPTTAATANFTLRETLADSPNSPRDTALSITVTAVGSGTLDPAITPPVLSLAVGATTYPPEFDADIDDTVAVGDTLELEWSSDIRFGTVTGSAQNTIDSAEATANAASFTGLSSITGPAVYYYRARVIQSDGDYSNWSNIVLHGEAVDETPAAFTFTDQTGVALSTVTESNAVQITGFNQIATISVTGGEYATSEDNVTFGSWTSTSGDFYPGDYVKVRHTTSGSNLTQTDTTLTIGGVSDTFSTTTEGAGAAVASHAVHTFDTVNKGYSSASHTFSGASIGTVDSTRVCVACIVGFDGGTNQPTGVTIGGVTATQVVGNSGSHITMWRASVPSGTTADVVATYGANIGWVGCILHSIINATPTPTSTANDAWAADATAPSAAVTVPTDGLAIAFAGRDATGATASWTGATASAFKDNTVWSIGTAIADASATVTAGGFGGNNNGLIVGVWGP